MRHGLRLSWLLIAVLLGALSGCGDGNGNTNGTLTLTVDPQMSLKGSVTARATLSSPTAATLTNVPIIFSTNKQYFVTQEKFTDPSGTASCLFTFSPPANPADAPTTDTPVTVMASYGGLFATATFIVKPAKMTVTAPATASYSGGGVAGSILRIVPIGTFVKVTDGDGTPLSNIPVTVKVAAIINGTAGDVLFWRDFPGGTVAAPPNQYVKNTDSLGTIPLQMTIDVVVPSVSHVVSINWEVSFTDPDSGATIKQYATTGITATP